MRKKAFTLISAIAFFTVLLQGQCPSGNLWARLVYLKESERLHPEKQLKKLLNIEDSIIHCSYPDDSTHAYLLARIANVYLTLGDFLRGVQYYKKSIKQIADNSGKASINLTHLPGRYYWLSVAYDSLNNFTERMKALDSCFAISMRLKFKDRSTLIALEARVQYFFDLGDYQRCVDYAARCQSLGREYANDNTGTEHFEGEDCAKNNLGWQVKALLQLKRFESAEELLRNKIEEYRKDRVKDYLGMMYGQLAGVQEQKGNYEKALSYYDQSLKYYQHTRDYFNCKQTAKDIGDIYFKHFSDWDKALVYYRKALKYVNKERSRDLADVFESLNIYGNIGNVYVQKGLYDSVNHYFQLALNQIKPGINEIEILNSPPEEFVRHKKIHYLAGLIIDKADAYRRQYEATGQPDAILRAVQIYKAADLLLNRVKSEQTELESKLFWRSDSRRLYENAINACYMTNNINDALYFFEKSRAVLLHDQLIEQHWLGEEDIFRQTQLNKKILQLERQLDTSDKSSSHYYELQNETFSSKEERERLKELIKINNPLYYQNFIGNDSITVKDVQQNILKDHKALVELFTGDSAVYLLVITAKKSYFQKVNKAVFDSLSGAYTKYISHSDLLNRDFDSYKQLSQQLYQLMFQNISLPAGRIIISPDGKYFPFEALVTNTRLPTYFLEDHAVSYTYSARYLLNNFTSASTSTNHTFIGIAPVEFTNGFPTLSGSDQSLRRMQDYFSDATNFVRSKASKNNFLQEYYKYKIIQLYTHATDSGPTGEPTIYFSDSLLLLSDLLPEKKPATSLIVLSACETAVGKLHSGEGVFSFNRQFAALGIPSSISNLWQVDNISTYKLTELFYKYVADGMPLDLALQKAKKELSKNSEYRLPYFWAASILIGQTNAIHAIHTQDSSWKWLGLIVLLLVLGFWNERKWLKQTS